jgi:GH24 family phage-related lysozyme (muramidase)
MRIKITKPTPLKLRLDQSAQLSEQQKITLPPGTVLDIAGAQVQGKHVVLMAYVFAEHCEVEDDGKRHISPVGLDLIKEFEGLELTAYLCPAGVWTIGYGSTSGVKQGDRITVEQAEALLRKDVERFEAAVAQMVRVPLTDNQFAALTSFAFNCGTEALRGSTLLRLLNAGDYQGAANQFLRWTRAGGAEEVPGLVIRRKAERELFLK